MASLSRSIQTPPPDKVEHGIRGQVAGAAATGYQGADLAGGDVQLGDGHEMDDARGALA